MTNPTPEQLLLADDDTSLARHASYIKLGIAVIMQSIQDATAQLPPTVMRPALNTTSGHTTRNDRRNEALQAQEDARAFLTTENKDLQFWCWLAGFHINALLYYARKADHENRWRQLGIALRAASLHKRKAA